MLTLPGERSRILTRRFDLAEFGLAVNPNAVGGVVFGCVAGAVSRGGTASTGAILSGVATAGLAAASQAHRTRPNGTATSQSLGVSSTKVGKKGLAELRRRLPNTKIR